MKLPEITSAFTVSFDGKIICQKRTPVMGLLARRKKSGGALRVIFCGDGSPLPELFDAPAVIFATKDMPEFRRRDLKKIASLHVEPRAKRINLRRALEILARDYGVSSVHCDGDAALFREIVLQDLAQTLRVTFVPLVLGGAKASTLLGPTASALLPHSVPLRLKSFRKSGDRAIASYVIGGKSQASANSRSRI